MATRMSNLDRMLTLVHALCESIEGLTLDEMAQLLGLNRRTIERMRNIILLHFDLDEISDGRTKRFRIRESLRRVYTKPNAAEIAALQSLVDAGMQEGTARTKILEGLLGKIKGALDEGERRRVDNDLELLTRLQRSRVLAGPAVIALPEDLTAIQGAILAGCCVEFDYVADGAQEAGWRRVVPYGLIHGPITYLIGKIPGRDEPPYTYRLDRMSNVRASNHLDCPPDDWDLDAWLAQSFGVWHEEEHEIVLRVRAWAVARAQAWRFHPHQQFEPDGDELLVRFRAGGLWEIAEHLFTWGSDIVIDGPDALREEMQERIAAAQTILGPNLTE